MEERSRKAANRDLSKVKSGSDTTGTVPAPKSMTYIDYEDPFALVHSSSGAPQIHKMSPHAWVGCGEDVYVLECLGKGWIRIEPTYNEKRTISHLLKHAKLTQDDLLSQSPSYNTKPLLHPR
jgi:ATP-dependent helicase IRC3